MEVLVFDLVPGMIVAEDLFTLDGEFVLSSGTIINEQIISKLETLALVHVKIHSKQNEDEINISTIKPSPYIVQRAEVQATYADAVNRYKSTFQSLRFGRQIASEDLDEMVGPLIDQVETNPGLAKQLWQLDICDTYTFDHSVCVSLTAALLAKWAGLDAVNIKRAAVAGLMHDIGKVNIPDSILNKPDKLTDDEMKVMKTHTTLGYVLLMNQKCLDDAVVRAALEHHERCDGMGYPHGLHDSQIPIISKIVSIADVFSAMTTKRVYRSATNPFKVAHVMLSESYGFLDPELTQLFISRISNYYVGNIVRLSDNRIGEVIMINRSQPHQLGLGIYAFAAKHHSSIEAWKALGPLD